MQASVTKAGGTQEGLVVAASQSSNELHSQPLFRTKPQHKQNHTNTTKHHLDSNPPTHTAIMSTANTAALAGDETTTLSKQYDTPLGLAHTTMQALKDRIKLHYDLASDYYLNLW